MKFSQESDQSSDDSAFDALDNIDKPLVSESEDVLARALVKNEMLGSICKESLLKTGRFQTIGNLEKLLKLWHLDPVNIDLISPQYQLCMGLLDGKRLRIQIAHRLASSNAPRCKENRSTMEGGMEKGANRVSFLDTWIASNADPPPQSSRSASTLPRTANIRSKSLVHSSIDTAKSKEDDAEFATEISRTKRIPKLEIIMTDSKVFRNLVTQFQLSLLPSFLEPLIATITSIQDVDVWFSSRQDRSISNQLKVFAKESTGQNWDWWPLRPKLRLLRDDETRLFWKCVSSVSPIEHKASSMIYSIVVRQCGRSYRMPMPKQSITSSNIGTLILSSLILVK